MMLNVTGYFTPLCEWPMENELHERRGYLISRICNSLCERMSRFSTYATRLHVYVKQSSRHQTCRQTAHCATASFETSSQTFGGYEKRRYLSNVTECNIFRVQAQYSIKPISNGRELRPNYVRHRSSYARRCEFKIPHLVANWN